MKKLIVSFALMVITLASYAQVYKMYSTQPLPDKLVEGTVAENKGVPLNQQKQS